MVEFLKKHFISVITLLLTVVVSVVVNFIEEISIFENLIFGLICLLVTTYIFDFDIMFDKIYSQQKSYEEHLNPSSIKDFDSVDKCALVVETLIKEGKHTVDFVSLDTKIRTQVKDLRRPMVKLLDKFVSNKNIKLRYITAINNNNYGTILKFMIKSKGSQRESFYALCESNVPFASFYIIDDKYLIIRTPYDSSVSKHYCVIEDISLVALFKGWFQMLWQTSKVIDTIDELKSIHDQVEFLSEQEKNKVTELFDEVKNYFGE